MECLYTSLDTDQIKLAGHPNIVEMVAVFADQVLGLPEDVQLYGDALPARLSPRVGVATVLAVSVQGCGRNMSLFSVMKKYDLSLADYLEKNRDLITPRTCLILLTQLLEGTQCVLNT
jgi:PTEN induced putative kinase 1